MKKFQINQLIILSLLYSFASPSPLLQSKKYITNSDEAHLLKLTKKWFELEANKLIFSNEKALRKEFDKLVNALRIIGLDGKSLNKAFKVLKKWQEEKLTETLISQSLQRKVFKANSKNLANLPFRYGR